MFTQLFVLLGAKRSVGKYLLSSVHIDLLRALPELLQHLGETHSHPLAEAPVGVGDPHLPHILDEFGPLDDAIASIQGVPPRAVRGRGQRGRRVGVEASGVAALLLHGQLDAPVIGLPQGLDPVDLGLMLRNLLSKEKEIIIKESRNLSIAIVSSYL